MVAGESRTGQGSGSGAQALGRAALDAGKGRVGASHTKQGGGGSDAHKNMGGAGRKERKTKKEMNRDV
jgi:hypothetical protein